MRTLFLLVTFTLSACTASLYPASVPSDLRSCPAGDAPSAPPPLPRTTESIADAYNKEKLAAEITYTALKVCREKLARLNAWVDSR